MSLCDCYCLAIPMMQNIIPKACYIPRNFTARRSYVAFFRKATSSLYKSLIRIVRWRKAASNLSAPWFRGHPKPMYAFLSCIEWKCKLLKVPTYQGLFRAATCYVALQSSLASFSARLITLLVFPAHVSPYTRRKSTSASTCPTSPFSTSVR